MKHVPIQKNIYFSSPAFSFVSFCPAYFLFVRAFFKILYAHLSFSASVILRALMRMAVFGMGIISLSVFWATFASSDLGVSPFLTHFLPDPLGKTSSFDLYSFRRSTFALRLSVHLFRRR